MAVWCFMPDGDDAHLWECSSSVFFDWGSQMLVSVRRPLLVLVAPAVRPVGPEVTVPEVP